jgi:nucleoside-diphosphate-sugar epimerase
MDYYYLNNVIGSRNVMEWCDEHKVRCMLMSSSEVYGTPEAWPIREDFPLNPQSPYAESKVAMEHLGLLDTRYDVVIARAFNTYGPRQTPRAVVAKIARHRALYGAGSEIEMGRTDTVRDWCYVEDTVDGLVKIMQHGKRRVTYNIGTGRALKVADVLKLAGLVAKTGESFDRASDEVLLLLADADKLRYVLLWDAKTTFEEGLAKTVEWWRSKSC